MVTISQKVNLDNVVFERTVSKRKSNPFVCYAPSSGTLYFNIVEQLHLEDWRDVLIGFDPKTQVIVLKKCSPEETGVRAFYVPSDKKGTKGKYKLVSVKTLLNRHQAKLAKRYKPERNGYMIYLDPIFFVENPKPKQ